MDTRAGADARRHLAGAAGRRLRRRAAARAARPRARARPVAVGAAATASAAIGFAVLQFLLGVDAPVSLLLVREILMTIVLNTLLALPVYLVCRRVLAPVPPRRPAPPPAPRLHHRRPEPAQPLLDAGAARRSPPADHAAARGARRHARRPRLRALRGHLLPPLVPAGPDRRRLRQPGAREPRAQGQDRGAARQHRRPQRPDAGQDARRAGRPDPADLGARGRAAAAEPTASRSRRPRAGAWRPRASCARSSACCAPTGAVDQAREAPAARAARRRLAAPSRADRPDPRRRARAALALPAARPGDRLEPRTIHRRVVQGIADQPSANVTIKTDVPPPPSTTCSSTARTSRASWSRRSTCATTRTRPWARSCSARCARSRRASSSAALPRGDAGHADRQGRDRGDLRRLPARDDGLTRVIVNSLGNRDDTRRTTRADPIQGRQLRLTLDLGSSAPPTTR